MAFSTGSGDYNALMAAVLAHAVADGWVEAGGIGTGWPISKGNVRGVDWQTFTEGATDYTGGAGVPKTTRWIRLCVGSSPANATANAALGAGNGAYWPNMEYTLDEWNIFSDPSIGDHINVVYKFSNGVDANVYGHFSFGELNKHGMTYGSLAYASAHPCRGFAADVNGDENFARDWQGGNYPAFYRHFTGRIGFSYTNLLTYNNFCYMTGPVNPPFSALPVWPQPDILYDEGRLLDIYGFHSSSTEMHLISESFIDGLNVKFAAGVLVKTSQPYSGGVSLAPLPVLIGNTTANSSTLRFINVGSAPNIRLCAMENVIDGQEITYAGDTWVVYPLLCRKANSTLGQQYQVTSGLFGFAYKKVI